MCDTHRATLTHVTPEVVPPALAIAERDGLPGRDLLVALAAGLEVTTRVGIGLDYPAFRARGWHGPGVIGPFGAAAAVGRLRGFDTETMAKAFGLAGSQAAGTFAAWGTPTVKFHQCRGALSGLMAALLAEQKFLATARIPDRQGRRALQRLQQRRKARTTPRPISGRAGSSSRSRCGCGRRRPRRRP
jgi:2-methylcitrate dehydratase PrpD